MLICLDCNRVFYEPKQYIETHNLDAMPYEKFWGCPICGGAYAELLECSCCEGYLIGEYFKTNDGKRYCEDCISRMELGDESND